MSPSELVRADLALEMDELNLMANERGLIGLEVFPACEVQLNPAQFAKIPIEVLLAPADDTRTSAGGYNRSLGKFEMDNYQTQEHGLEEVVDDREAKIYGRYFDAEQKAANRKRHALLLNLERRIATAALAASTNTPAAASVLWSTAASAVPINDVDTARLLVRSTCGMIPNCVAMTFEAFLNVRRCAQIVDRVKYFGVSASVDDPYKIGPRALAAAFGVEEVLIAGAVYNTANEPQTAALASCWDRTKALVFYRDKSTDLREVTFGRTIHYTADGSNLSGGVEAYRDESVRANVVRVRMEYVPKLMREAAAAVITTVIA